MTSNIKNALKGAALISAMALGLVISTSTNVAAQNNRGYDRDDDRYDQQDRNRQNDRDRYSQNNAGQQRRIQAAFDKGYRDGKRAGQQAARGSRNNGYYGNNGSYGNNNGYYGNNGSNNGYYGNNGGYSNGRGNAGMQQAYQQGYQRGYQESLNGNRNRNRRSSVWPF